MANTQEEQKEILVAHPDTDLKHRLMPSNSGRGSFELSILGPAPQPENVVVKLNARGEFFDNQKIISAANLVPDFDLQLHQVVMRRAALSLLDVHLSTWMQEMAPFTIDLGPSRQESSISVIVDCPERFICSKDKPIFMVRYSGPLLDVEIAFKIDQSCIRTWFEGIP
jgi:hypothetical protein